MYMHSSLSYILGGRNDKLGEATRGGETTRGKTTREGNSFGAKHPGFRQNAEHSGK